MVFAKEKSERAATSRSLRRRARAITEGSQWRETRASDKSDRDDVGQLGPARSRRAEREAPVSPSSSDTSRRSRSAHLASKDASAAASVGALVRRRALTGLCGVALIGAALYLDLDASRISPRRRNSPASAPPTLRKASSPGKGDRLLRPVDIVAAKQTFKVATPSRSATRRWLRRALSPIADDPDMTPTGFADAVPPFNPLKLTNADAATADAAPDPGPVQDDAEVTFKTRHRRRRGRASPENCPTPKRRRRSSRR